MINPGNYKVKATDATIVSSQEGKPGVEVLFSVDGELVSWRGYFYGKSDDIKEKNINTALRSLKACGWKGDVDRIRDGIRDNEVEIKVEIEEWNGKSRARVAYIKTPGQTTSTAKAATPQQVAELKQILAAHERRSSARVPGAVDDLPF